MTTPTVTLYTTPGCPDCRAVGDWLERHDVPFTERDLTDRAVMHEAKMRYGVRIAPITVIGDDAFHGTFDLQIPRLRAALGVAQTA